MNNINNKNMKVPEGWEVVRLGDVVDVFDSQRIPLDGEYRSTIKGNIPYCGATGVIDFINDFIFDGEYVLIAEDGGKFQRFEETAYIMNGKFWANNHVHIVRGKNSLENLFLKYFISFEDISYYISGSTREKLNQQLLKSILIPLPPLTEQQRIAEILETVDRAIEKTDKIIEKYKRIKQGLMQDLLTRGIDENGKIRSEKTHKFRTSPIGRIPEEWEVVRLGEVSEIKGGKRLPKGEELIDEGHPYIRLVDIEGIRVNASKVKYIPEKIKQLISRYIVSKNDVILSIAGTIGLVALIPNELDGSNLTENAVKITNLKNLDKNFLAFTLSNYLVQRQINMLTGVVAQPKLALFRLATIPIPLPPFPEQQRIAEILSQIDNTIEKKEAYKQKLECIKKGLMGDLLTGRVRVNELIKEKEVGYE